MDVTLVVNPGSASKKYSFFKEGRQIFSLLFEHVGDGYGKCVEINETRQKCESIRENTFESSVEETIAIAIAEGIIKNVDEISCVGIRVVAPGTFFESHRIVDDLYVRNLKKMEDAAPLHIPHTLHEITMLKKFLPTVRCIGVSDSAFHSSIPEYARRYSISRVDREKFDIYRFGYHGLSVRSVVEQSEIMTGEPSKRIIVCHIGSGVSITAVREGKSVETTMGFSPTSGLMMNSRSGDFDSGALLYLMKKKNLTIHDAETYITKQGGFVGLLGQGDLRIALDKSTKGDTEAQIAVDSFIHTIRKAIGAYIAVLGGIDLLILTATAAERNSYVRELVCQNLEDLGIIFDKKLNEECGGRSGILSHGKSAVKIMVVHTREMEQIAHVAEIFSV